MKNPLNPNDPTNYEFCFDIECNGFYLNCSNDSFDCWELPYDIENKLCGIRAYNFKYGRPNEFAWVDYNHELEDWFEGAFLTPPEISLHVPAEIAGRQLH